MLDIDDIHDRDNSSSGRERKVVVDILVKTILKTVIKENDKMTTWLIAVGTPWALDDAYYTMKNTGQYEFISIPAMVKAEVGQGVYIDRKNRDGMVFEDIVGWWHLTFPEHFGVKTVIKGTGGRQAKFLADDYAGLGAGFIGEVEVLRIPTSGGTLRPANDGRRRPDHV